MCSTVTHNIFHMPAHDMKILELIFEKQKN